MDNPDASKESNPNADPDASIDALETPEATGTSAQNKDDKPDTPKKSGGLKQSLKKFNIYLVLFLFILVIAGVIIAIAYFQSKQAQVTTIKAQNLSNQTLQQLANSDATVGSSQEVLNVEANAVFAGKVLVRDTLEVAGGLDVTGSTNLQDITVAGDTNLQSADVAKDLTVGGTLAVQGSATFTQGIQSNGAGTFTGALSAPSITVTSLQLNGNLILTHHITAGGPTPAGNSDTALGSGGTASLSGSDTAGEVSINTGGGPGIGCFITVTFNQAYSQTPYVLVTPVGQNSGGIQYYVTRTTTNFSICTDSAAPGGANFGFDYFVVD